MTKNEKAYLSETMISETEKDAVRKEMTMEEIKALPNVLGKLASVNCYVYGEYKYMNTTTNEKTHIVLLKE